SPAPWPTSFRRSRCRQVRLRLPAISRAAPSQPFRIDPSSYFCLSWRWRPEVHCAIELVGDMAHIGHNLVEFCRRQRILERLDMLGPRSAGSGVADAVAQRQAYDQLMARGQCGKQASEFRIVMKRGHEIGTKMSA